jgi:peptidoglycan/xylan/chitin deacetylase (PgdA/CDA1 family)
VLAYHGVGAHLPWPMSIPVEILEEQVSRFHARGYVGLTYADWERRLASGDLPDRSVVVTFDDGYASTLNALPVLNRFGYPGTVFATTDFIEGRASPWPGLNQSTAPALSWAELETMVEKGWEVGSHTVNHPRLSKVADSILESELKQSRDLLIERLGSCETVAYPHGDADSRVAAAAAHAGYIGGCTLTEFHLIDEPLLRPRIGMGVADRGIRLRFKTSAVGARLRRSHAHAWTSGGGRAELARLRARRSATNNADQREALNPEEVLS